MNKQHFAQIDALKGVAIFFVVLAHAIILYPVNLMENPVCNGLFQVLSSVHMPIFFLVSGYCFSIKDGYKTYLLKKVKRILVPYFVFGFVDMIPRQLFSGLVNRSKGLGESLIDMLLYGGEYWFLYTLFVIFLVYPLVYHLQKGKLILQIVIELGLLAIVFIPIPISLFTLDKVAMFLLFFNTGVLIRESNLKVFDWNFRKEWMYGISLLGLSLLWLVCLFNPIVNVPAVCAIVGSAVIYLLMQKNMFMKCFARFGQYSLQLYLLNGFLLVISRTIICKLTVNPVAIIGFNMLIDFALSYFVIKYICAKIKPLRVLMGM